MVILKVFLIQLEKFVDAYPDLDIIAGNVATAEGNNVHYLKQVRMLSK